MTKIAGYALEGEIYLKFVKRSNLSDVSFVFLTQKRRSKKCGTAVLVAVQVDSCGW